MCSQAVVIGVRRIIKTLKPLYENRARNSMDIHTQNRTRVDVPSSPNAVSQRTISHSTKHGVCVGRNSIYVQTSLLCKTNPHVMEIKTTHSRKEDLLI
jgi:hypothetical protein